MQEGGQEKVMVKGKKSKIKIAIDIAYYIFIAFMAVIIVAMWASKSSGKVFFLGDKAMVWVLTGSMEEQIPASSYVCIKKADASEVKVGDVITFYSDDPSLRGGLNTHRVVEIVGGGEEFVTKGDNNNINDRVTAKADKIVGIYHRNMPFMTLVGRAFQSKIGLICIIGVAVAISVAVFFGDIRREFIRMRSGGDDTDKDEDGQ